MKSFIKNTTLLTSCTLITLLLACKPEFERISTNPNHLLYYSTDSINFDTIFSTQKSTTQRLKIYNLNKESIQVNIKLYKQENSPFSTIINGQATPSSHQTLLPNDSLLILIDITPIQKNTDTPIFLSDSLTFEYNSNVQHIVLTAYSQDTYILEDSIISSNQSWNEDRPYLLSGKTEITENTTLTINEGTKIYFNNKAELIVKGTLQVKGSKEKPVSFTNSRWDENYKDAFGQWQGITFTETSNNNQINFTNIRNATIAIKLKKTNLTLEHTRIENMSNTGIAAYESTLTTSNLLINNCINRLITLHGGSYTLIHCTISNQDANFIRSFAGVHLANNYLNDNNQEILSNFSLQLKNTIIHGGLENEIELVEKNGATLTLETNNNIIKTNEIDKFNINNNILNKDPLFQDPSNYHFEIMPNSPAKDTGIDLGIIDDLIATPRDEKPDIGAFEHDN